MQAKDWQYLGEGNANVIFTYIGPSDDRWTDMVLRLQKYSTPDAFSAEQQQNFLETVIKTRFPELWTYLLLTQLVQLDEEFLRDCQGILEHSSRPGKYLGSRIDCSVSFGLLLPCLSSDTRRQVLEFKPKWLSQSPSAPADARLCRTCALRFMRTAPCSEKQSLRFCPLDLASDDPQSILRALQALNRDSSWNLSPKSLHNTQEFLQREPIIAVLKAAQMASMDKLDLCMTLRDCSVYLLLDRDTQQITRACLADLDCKRRSKETTWHNIEHALINQGWYLAGQDTGLQNVTECSNLPQ